MCYIDGSFNSGGRGGGPSGAASFDTHGKEKEERRREKEERRKVLQIERTVKEVTRAHQASRPQKVGGGEGGGRVGGGTRG